MYYILFLYTLYVSYYIYRKGGEARGYLAFGIFSIAAAEYTEIAGMANPQVYPLLFKFSLIGFVLAIYLFYRSAQILFTYEKRKLPVIVLLLFVGVTLFVPVIKSVEVVNGYIVEHFTIYGLFAVMYFVYYLTLFIFENRRLARIITNAEIKRKQQRYASIIVALVISVVICHAVSILLKLPPLDIISATFFIALLKSMFKR